MARTFARKLDGEDSSVRPSDIPDEDLLEQFLGGDELESQDAFRASVGRHGPSSLSICRPSQCS